MTRNDSLSLLRERVGARGDCRAIKGGPMARDIKVAFAGAQRASGFFRTFAAHPETQIVALCDVNEQALATAGEASGVSQLYTHFEVMLDHTRPDAVVFVDAICGRRLPATGIHEAMDMTLPGLVSQESIRRGGAWLSVPDSRDW